jgi:hypothetical protein
VINETPVVKSTDIDTGGTLTSGSSSPFFKATTRTITRMIKAKEPTAKMIFFLFPPFAVGFPLLVDAVFPSSTSLIGISFITTLVSVLFVIVFK